MDDVAMSYCEKQAGSKAWGRQRKKVSGVREVGFN